MRMKKNIVFALLMLMSLGISTALVAQSSGKKKKKKHKTTAATTDSVVAVPPPADTTAKLNANTSGGFPTPPDGVMDTSHSDGLVADTTAMDYLNFPLDSTRPVDGLYKIPVLRGAKAFAFPIPNKNNIKFYKRIWRVIDLTDSVNRIFATPGETMMSIIMDAIKAQKIIAYKDEGFRARLSYASVMKAFSDSSIVPVIDSLTGEQTGTRAVFNPFNPDSITKFEIKEDIFFDKIRGRVVTQIVGLAPIRKVKSSDGVLLGEQHPFYLYFPQCRNLFAGKELYDTQRDIYNISYDDIFASRNFNTTIVKESNPADLRIKDKYPDEENQKKEADRIEQGIRDYKKNLWKY